jgi:molybdate transport system substrate-binding protein
MPKRALLFTAAILSLPLHAAEVHVAVAANFAAPMQKLAAQFESQTGHKAVLSNGATGKLYAQIVNGAPFDVLLAADDETPARLAREGKAVEASRFTYAIGKLALWSADPGYVDAEGRALARADLTHLAIANPKTAPYGAAAVEVLKALGQLERLQGRFVQGENITQTYQFAASGNAKAAFVALSQVFENGKLKSGSAWVVPSRLHAPIRQDAVLLDKGKSNPAADALLRYLKSEPARALIRQYGYDL